MQEKNIYAFDFDGVICDSAIETSITGWKAAQVIWPDIKSSLPPESLIQAFKQVRPQLETGYEAILIMYLLQLGKTADELCTHYEILIAELIKQENLETHHLKTLFGKTRDHWITTDEKDWLNMNPLFSDSTGVTEKLKSLADSTWYVITTKQERFVKLILEASGISIEDNQLFGMDKGLSKEDTLLILQEKHPDQHILFIEDRLQTLFDILDNHQLQAIKLQLVSWGFNTPEERLIAQKKEGIEVIDSVT